MSWRSCAVCLLLVFGLGAPASAAGVEFRKVVDTQTPIPGGTDLFSFIDFPSLDAGKVAFSGGGSGAEGVYREGASGLEVVADLTTAAPGTTSTFTSFGNELSHDEGLIAFKAWTAGDPVSEEGIFASADGTLVVVVDETTHFPEPSGPSDTYHGFHDGVVDGGAVYFFGRRNSDVGVHRYQAGVIGRVFDANIAMPGGTTDLEGFRYAAGGGGVAITANGMFGEEGVYRVLPSSLEVVADWMTTVPGSSDVFVEFSHGAAVHGDRVGIISGGVSSHGIYIHQDGVLSALVDLSTPVPEAPGESFDNFGSLSLDGDDTAFSAIASDGTGFRESLYVMQGGTLRRVISVGDALDGKVVTYLWMAPEALDGDELAFFARLDGVQDGIYVATLGLAPPVPALPVLGVALLAGLLLATGAVAVTRRATPGEHQRIRAR